MLLRPHYCSMCWFHIGVCSSRQITAFACPAISRSAISCPAVSCPVIWSVIFTSCNFTPCKLVRQFHDRHFYVQHFQHLNCSVVTRSCDPACSVQLTCESTSHDPVTPLRLMQLAGTFMVCWGCFRLVITYYKEK